MNGGSQITQQGPYPGYTKRRDGECVVVCSACGHETVSREFGWVNSPNESDAWVLHRKHYEQAHGARLPA